MSVFLVFLLLQSSLLLPPRSAVENPAVDSPVPAKIKKDYDKMWARFLSGKEDAKLEKDLDNLLKKRKSFDQALTLEGYIDLYKGDDAAAREKFTQSLNANSNNRIALWYLAELAFAHNEYALATTLYAQLLTIDSSRSEIETKHQRSLLLATDEILRSASRAEGENRLAEAEQYYRQALSIVPNDPTLHTRLADLLARANKNDEADAERKIVEGLKPEGTGTVRAADETKIDSLDDLGRWGSQIELLHQIRSAEAVTREQVSAIIVRYFPQLTELRQTPQIVTDTDQLPARSEIQTVIGLGLIEARPNHIFEPSSPITRLDFAQAFGRVIRLLGLSPATAPVVTTPALDAAYAPYPDAQLGLALGLAMLQDSSGINLGGQVTGAEAVRIAEQLVRTFQQTQH